MMPYIAILIDSFWETVGNRVLWALLIGWSIILAGLAPFGYVSEQSYSLTNGDINDLDLLRKKLVESSQGKGSPAAQAVASQLDREFLDKLITEEKEEPARRRLRNRDMVQGLRTVLSAEKLYSVDAFPTAANRERLAPLIERVTQLSVQDREQLNRELMQIAFPVELNLPRSEKLWIGYGGFKLGEPLQMPRSQIHKFIEPLLLQLILKLGLGVVAVFVSLIVTSPLVPETFKSGSLHLLLSKPISRVWLYFFKVFGGCVFVLVNITFVLLGLYFIAGFRFDVWNQGLLACIPLLMFVFVIFYSVSALVGLIWGNAIICVVSCLVFWLACFAVGAIYEGMLRNVDILPQISRIETIDGNLIVVNQRGEVGVWNEAFQIWQPALDGDNEGPARTFGPLYDSRKNSILVKAFRRGPFGQLGARNRKIDIIALGEASKSGAAVPQASVESLAESSEATTGNTAGTVGSTNNAPSTRSSTSGEPIKTLDEARKTAYWTSEVGPDIPAQLVDLIQVDGEAIAVCRSGLYRFNWDKVSTGSEGGGLLKSLRSMLPGLLSSNQGFENIAPADYALSDYSSAAVVEGQPAAVICSSGNLDWLDLSEQRLVVSRSVKLEGGEGTEPTLLLANGACVLVARDDLPLAVFNRELQPQLANVDLKMPDGANVRQMAWIPASEDAAVLTHLGNVYRFNCKTGTLTQILGRYAGSITCLRWQNGNRVWLGIKPNRVVEFDVAAEAKIKEYRPTPATVDLVYNWIIKPLYNLNPKPSAMDNAMSYLLTGTQTSSLNIVSNDLKQAQVELDVRGPLISNMIFVAVMLGIGAIYVSRKEF